MEIKKDGMLFNKGNFNKEMILKICMMKITKVIIGFMAALFLSFGIFLMIKSFGRTTEDAISFNETGKVDYKVHLKENDFFEEKYLDSGMSYVATLIDKIAANFDYNFNINNDISATFYYDVDAELKITDSMDTNVLYSKIFNLSDTETGKLEKGSIYNINKSVDIDYGYYNNIAQQFKNQYGIDTISYLIVNLNIHKLSDVDYKDFEKEKVVSLKIPLTQKAINISLASDDMENLNNTIYPSKLCIESPFRFVLSIVMILFGLVSLLAEIYILRYEASTKTTLTKTVDKLLRAYDRLIINISTHPSFDGKNIIKINEFNELVDIRDNLKIPIIYYPVTEGKKCLFYIEHEDKVYLLSLKNSDLEMKNEK